MEIETRKVNKEIKVKLSMAEIANLGKEYASIFMERANLEEEIKTYSKPRKDRIKAIDEEDKKIAEAIDSGESTRMEEVEMQLDYDTGTVSYFREGEKFEERAMTESERQVKMFNDNKDGFPEPEGQEQDEEPKASDIRDVIQEETGRNKADLLTVN